VVVIKVRVKLAENEQGSLRCPIERFILKKLIIVHLKEKYHVEVSNKFSALENLDAVVENIIA
jgi:hypothetical protein